MILEEEENKGINKEEVEEKEEIKSRRLTRNKAAMM